MHRRRHHRHPQIDGAAGTEEAANRLHRSQREVAAENNNARARRAATEALQPLFVVCPLWGLSAPRFFAKRPPSPTWVSSTTKPSRLLRARRCANIRRDGIAEYREHHQHHQASPNEAGDSATTTENQQGTKLANRTLPDFVPPHRNEYRSGMPPMRLGARLRAQRQFALGSFRWRR